MKLHTRRQSSIATEIAQFSVASVLRCGLLLLSLLVIPVQPLRAQDVAPGFERGQPERHVDALVRLLTRGSFSLAGQSGKVLGERRHGNDALVALTVRSVARRLRASHLTPNQIAKLWAFFADEDNASLLALPIIESLVVAGNTPKGRAALWSEMAYLMRTLRDKRSRRAKSLLGLFERHRARLRPLLAMGRDTEIGGDEMIDLMISSRVLGANFGESLAWVCAHNPASVARRVEFERGRGRPVRWENEAFRAILKWKDARFSQKVTEAPRSVAELDQVGQTFTVIFNNLHELNESYRERMLQGLEAADAFNVVIGGEFELYRMGTSSYREYLHPLIMRGIKERGSYEAFVEQAMPDGLGEGRTDALGRRSMVFLRVVSTFALLDDVLETVRDRDRFIESSLSSLGDPKMFRRNGLIIVDLLTAPSTSVATASFKSILIEKLYERYRSEQLPTLRNVYGSMLSVYQTVTGDRREAAIDRAYPLDSAMFHISFNRLFRPSGKHGLIHRMFMRMDEDNDAVTTYAGFHAMMRSRGAKVQNNRHYVVYRFTSGERTIEIYVNKPTSLGITRGIADVAAALRGKHVETVIGRGHTFIINPLLRDAKRILGDQVRDAAVVMIGSCGGEASMRDIIKTFGYTSIVSTRSTGRQVINNAIIDAYVKALFSLQPGNRLFLKDVLKRAVRQFARPGADNDLRDDSRFYRLSMSAVLTAFLFDTHVRRYAEATVR